MGTATVAFNQIGKMLFPIGYMAGYQQEDAALIPPQKTAAKADPHLIEFCFWEANAYTDHACFYIKDDKNPASGGFRAFTTFSPYHGEKTFNPKIVVRTIDTDSDGSKPRTPEAIEGSLIHEMIHLRQIASITPEKRLILAASYNAVTPCLSPGADILYANISNSASPIVLSPRAAMELVVLAEADAYSKTAWIMSLATDRNPAALDALEFDGISVRNFLKIEEAAPSVQHALRNAALASMDKSWGTSIIDNKTPWTFRDYYQNYVLDQYVDEFSTNSKTREWWNLRLRSGEEIEFFRADLGSGHTDDARSVLKIGDSFGPNPFEQDGGIHPAFLNHALKPDIAAKLALVEKTLGISESKLRSYNEVRKAWGYSPQEYMQLAENGGQSRPLPSQDRMWQPVAPPGGYARPGVQINPLYLIRPGS